MKRIANHPIPTHVAKRHDLSILLGKAFAMSYAIHTHCEQTTQLLDIYRESRRMVDHQPSTGKRYGAWQAHNATQGQG